MSKNSNKFNPGFRLSYLDVAVILLGICAAIFFYQIFPIISFIILFVVGHFFLFCNIIRLSRIPELIWATSFLFLAGSNLLFAMFDWLFVATISLIITSVLVVLETRKPGYHGLLWQKINPNLPQWFKQQCGYQKEVSDNL